MVAQHGHLGRVVGHGDVERDDRMGWRRTSADRDDSEPEKVKSRADQAHRGTGCVVYGRLAVITCGRMAGFSRMTSANPPRKAADAKFCCWVCVLSCFCLSFCA